ncbi:zinc-dependent alcohol dehydrogenase [Cohnella thailandensis]|uniref:Zinc-binding alcohol dehydrogenase n=1 Tax=Cohnella thailandensis TaxID=557557 RepID=A0A841T172_9BACL|nr:zinc-binding alcohol dehydrogenase [Cohnella thailandensis]MBB6634821.1 zinc-binding alcohol dehydrogenase [Cohnella thailandensis]MBP1975958.1 2-desacetyl-2-hydroxyethyl bacteriochlorophyllide A dehydrogenase [Cohnella thailandensis]
MKQIVVNEHAAVLEEAEAPALTGEQPYRVLVKVRYSSISPGTELNLIHNMEVPAGFKLGYSASGEVVAVGSKVKDLKPGDYVACYGGPYVYHAEQLSVPRQLCVKLSSETWLREAALVGLGSVAIHSVRRIGLQFGETVWVVGLGLLGQLIVQFCKQANYRVLATDMDPARVEIARSYGVEAYLANDPGLDGRISRFTEGHGFDGIALVAHSNSSKIIETTMEKLAFRGKYALVGNVPIEFPRELFFQKEADFIIARAAGPGRYDEQYEDGNVDYPKSYVRWTEGRNMAEYVRQLEEGITSIAPLFTKEYSIDEAPQAYVDMKRDVSKVLGVLLRYGG